MKQGEEKAQTVAHLKCSANGAVVSSGTSSSVHQSQSKSKSPFLTISAYDVREGAAANSQKIKSTSSDGIPVKLNAGKDPRLSVQIGCFRADSVAPAPKKLSVDQLKTFQQQQPVLKPPPGTQNNSNLVKNNFRSVTLINPSGSVDKMMTMMSAIDSASSTTSSSPSSSSSSSSKNSELLLMDTFGLDSGTCSDLEINSSSSSLNNSITPPPPPLPKKMNKTKEKLKSENEKFFHLKNYAAAPAGNTTSTSTDQDDNLSVHSSCSSISCDSLNASNASSRRILRMISPTTTTTCYTSSGGDSPTPSSIGGDPPVIVSDPHKLNAIVLSVNKVEDTSSPPPPPINRFTSNINKNLLPTSLLADIRSNKRSNGDLQKKNVNVISIRGKENSSSSSSSSVLNEEDEDEDEEDEGVGGDINKKFINFSIHSMMDEGVEEQNEEETKGRFFQKELRGVKSAFASIESRKSLQFENDSYYTFHINEREGNKGSSNYQSNSNQSDKSIEDSFAGYRDLSSAFSPTASGSSTIRSNKGTIRGVKNRVRNGIATFLQMQQTNVKNYKEKDAGKVVIYTTTMGIVRDTYAKCANVKQILRTLLIKFEERDVFMSNEYQQEVKDRMQSDVIKVPQLFVDGQYVGDADAVERLNESGELRKMLKPYQSLDPSFTCQACGGYRLLPCPSCNGSKKSVHRNHFTAEFLSLKCMNCDEVGLVRCHSCC